MIMVGIKVTVALTDLFKITSYRNNVMQTIVFNDGIPTVLPVEELKKPRHGLDVVLKPSEKYLGELFLTLDMVEDYIRKMSYIIPDDLTIEVEGTTVDGKSRKTEFHAMGLAKNVEYLSSQLEFKIVDLNIETPNFDMEIAFSYDKSLDMPLVQSYCNFVVTKEGGCHETAFYRAICEYFVKEARNLDPNSKYEVTYDDCKKGLVGAVAGWHYDPGFEGQHKTKISNKDFIDVGKDLIKQALGEYFERNSDQLRKIVSFLRKNVQIRMEALKIKGAKAPKPKNALDYMTIPNFEDITDPNYSTASEILIAEGVSAVTAINNVRNRAFQAIYGVTGVVDNITGLTWEQIMTLPTFRNLIIALGCGIGPTFNIQNLRFKKIIILTDKTLSV